MKINDMVASSQNDHSIKLYGTVSGSPQDIKIGADPQAVNGHMIVQYHLTEVDPVASSCHAVTEIRFQYMTWSFSIH